MTTPTDGPWTLHHSAEAEWAALAKTLGGYLVGLLTRKFEVPERDAVWLVQEAFADYLRGKPAPNARAWLIAQACKTANDYRQRRGLPAANEDIARHATTDLLVREAMERLSSRAREALRLRFEKKTYAEIAEELGISTSAAERFVAKALAKLRCGLRGEGTRPP